MITHALLRTALKRHVETADTAGQAAEQANTGQNGPAKETDLQKSTRPDGRLSGHGNGGEWDRWENPQDEGDTLDLAGLVAALWEEYRVEGDVENLSVCGWVALAEARRGLAEFAARYVRRADTQRHILEHGSRRHFHQLTRNANLCPSVWEPLQRRWRTEDTREPFGYEHHVEVALGALRWGREADWLHRPHDPCGLEAPKLFGFVDRGRADAFTKMTRTRLHILSHLGLEVFTALSGDQRALSTQHLIDLTFGYRIGHERGAAGPELADEDSGDGLAAEWWQVRERLGKEWLARRWERKETTHLRDVVLPLLGDGRTDPELRIDLLAAVGSHERAWEQSMWVAAAGRSIDCHHPDDPYLAESGRQEVPVGYPHDMEALIAAAERRGGRISPWILWVNGWGPQPGAVEDIVSRPPTCGHVIWSPHVEDDVMVEIAAQLRWAAGRYRATILRCRPHLADQIEGGEIIVEALQEPGAGRSVRILQHVLGNQQSHTEIHLVDMNPHLDWVSHHLDELAAINWGAVERSSPAWRSVQALRDGLADWIASQLGDDPERWSYAWQLTGGGWEGTAQELIHCVDLASGKAA